MKGLLGKLGLALFALMVVTIVDLTVRDHVDFVDAAFSTVALVAEGVPLTAMTTHDLEHRFDCALLKHRPHRGEPHLHPKEARDIGVGDILMVNTTFAQLAALKDAAGDTAS